MRRRLDTDQGGQRRYGERPEHISILGNSPTVRRLFAAIIDFLIVVVVGACLSEPWIDKLYTESDWNNPLMGAWLVSTYLFLGQPYYALCEVLSGRTIGKALLGIKVVSLSGKVSRWRMLVRNLVRVTWAIPDLGYPFIMFLDALLIFTTKKHQRLGDMIAGTTVVRTGVKVADK